MSFLFSQFQEVVLEDRRKRRQTLQSGDFKSHGICADIDVMSVVERQLEPKQLWIGQLRSLLNHLNEVCTINETLKKKL